MIERQKELVKLLEMNDGEWLTQDYIIESNIGYVKNNNTLAHDKCAPIWNDITFINNETDYERIILIDNNTYKLGNQEEFVAYIEKQKKKALICLKRVSNLTKKSKLNGMLDLLKNDFVEVFK